MDYNFFMEQAYKEALKAYDIDEVPIGCVIVKDNKIIAKAHNKRNTEKNTLKHAEMIAIDRGCNYVNDWRLEGCVMFVTVEPCPMCSGAILQARIDKVVFGTKNNKAGCCGSILNILQDDRFNHKVDIMEGVLEEKCSMLMKDFFKNIRKREDKNGRL